MASTHTTKRKTTDDKEMAEARVSDKLHDAVTHAQESVQDAANSVRDTVLAAADRTIDRTQTLQGDFDSAVRRNPTLAVLGALGVGVVLGLALTKRS